MQAVIEFIVKDKMFTEKKMKKILSLFVLTFCLMLTVGLISACSDNYCSHSYKVEITKEATCTETGIATYKCSKCNESYSSVIPKNDHDYVSEEVQTATCTQEGIVKYTCSLCKFSYEQKSDPLGHTTAPIGAAVEATCIKAGITAGSRCTTCNAVLEEQKIIPIVDHIYNRGVCKWCSDEKTYYVTFTANGQVVEKVPYTVSSKSIEEPDVPEDPYCVRASWESYELGYSDITVNALYTYKNYDIT